MHSEGGVMIEILRVLCGRDVATRFVARYEMRSLIFMGTRSIVMEAYSKVSGKMVCIKMIPSLNVTTNSVPFEVYVHAYIGQHADCVLPILDYYAGNPLCVIVSPLWGYPWVQGEMREKGPLAWKITDIKSVQQRLDLSSEDGKNVSKAISDLYNTLPMAAYRDLHSCLLSPNVNLSEEQVRNIFENIVKSVKQIRNLGFIHNDLKDENILINERLEIKIIDFGSSEFIGERTSIFRGTLKFACPEIENSFGSSSGIQCGGILDLHAQEIWTLGCILYGLMTATTLTGVNSGSGSGSGVGVGVGVNTCGTNQRNESKLMNIMLECLMKDPKRRISIATLTNVLTKEDRCGSK